MQVTGRTSGWRLDHPKLDPIANWFPTYNVETIAGTCVFAKHYYLEL